MLQAEIAFYQGQQEADWHVSEIASALPGYCSRLGEDLIRHTFDERCAELDELYGLAARQAVDHDVMIKLPTLITGRAVGGRHRVSHVETRHVFPKGGHGIRAYDSTYIPPKRRTVQEAQGDAAFIREKDAVAKFHGKTRRTVNRWVLNEDYAAKLAEMKAALDPRSARPVTPVTRPVSECPVLLIEDYKEIGDMTVEGVTNDNSDLSRCPDFLRELAAWKGIKVASLRVYRKRETLPALIEEYLDHLDDLAASEAVAEMAREDADMRLRGAA